MYRVTKVGKVAFATKIDRLDNDEVDTIEDLLSIEGHVLLVPHIEDAEEFFDCKIEVIK